MGPDQQGTSEQLAVFRMLQDFARDFARDMNQTMQLHQQTMERRLDGLKTETFARMTEIKGDITRAMEVQHRTLAEEIKDTGKEWREALEAADKRQVERLAVHDKHIAERYGDLLPLSKKALMFWGAILMIMFAAPLVLSLLNVLGKKGP